jgi:hypothetical protein
MNNVYKPEPGDIYLIKGNTLISKWVRLLISIRYGIPFKLAYSHIETSYDENTNISAEPSGIKLMNNRRFDKKCDYRVYRLKKMDNAKKERHQKISERYIGKGYAYARYLLDFVRIGSFYLFLTGIMFAILGMVFSLELSKYLAFASGVFFVLLTAMKPSLIKKDIVTHDCTELTSIIFAANGLWVPPAKSRNEFPDGMKQVLDNLLLNGSAEVVFDNYRDLKPRELKIASATA